MVGAVIDLRPIIHCGKYCYALPYQYDFSELDDQGYMLTLDRTAIIAKTDEEIAHAKHELRYEYEAMRFEFRKYEEYIERNWKWFKAHLIAEWDKTINDAVGPIPEFMNPTHPHTVYHYIKWFEFFESPLLHNLKHVSRKAVRLNKYADIPKEFYDYVRQPKYANQYGYMAPYRKFIGMKKKHVTSRYHITMIKRRGILVQDKRKIAEYCHLRLSKKIGCGGD